MVSFIDDHRSIYGVEPICSVIPIAPSTYYAHKVVQADPELRSDRAKRDEYFQGEICRIWQENFQVYGVRKVWRQLGREGIDVASCTSGLNKKKLIRARKGKYEAVWGACPEGFIRLLRSLISHDCFVDDSVRCTS